MAISVQIIFYYKNILKMYLYRENENKRHAREYEILRDKAKSELKRTYYVPQYEGWQETFYCDICNISIPTKIDYCHTNNDKILEHLKSEEHKIKMKNETHNALVTIANILSKSGVIGLK